MGWLISVAQQLSKTLSLLVFSFVCPQQLPWPVSLLTDQSGLYLLVLILTLYTGQASITSKHLELSYVIRKPADEWLPIWKPGNGRVQNVFTSFVKTCVMKQVRKLRRSVAVLIICVSRVSVLRSNYWPKTYGAAHTYLHFFFQFSWSIEYFSALIKIVIFLHLSIIYSRPSVEQSVTKYYPFSPRFLQCPPCLILTKGWIISPALRSLVLGRCWPDIRRRLSRWAARESAEISSGFHRIEYVVLTLSSIFFTLPKNLHFVLLAPLAPLAYRALLWWSTS